MADDAESSNPKGDTVMKKLMGLMLGLSIALGSVAMFAQDTTTKETTATKSTKKKKAPKKTKDTTKTDAPKG